VIYFNGFSLQGEEKEFETYLIDNDVTVCGFSYGAQQAFEYVYNSTNRIERLILLSPAFFQTQKASFIRTQLRYFESAQERYMEHFLDNVVYPASVSLLKYLHVGRYDELEALLRYRWDEAKIQEVLDRGTIIEVFLGDEDKIIDVKSALEFFSPMVTTYCIKGAGHLLRGKER